MDGRVVTEQRLASSVDRAELRIPQECAKGSYLLRVASGDRLATTTMQVE
ncbi:MAG: hypothetical protein IPJ85_16945 [Flavobacteriales bacterium]|nr:hypothetical protein [Flavobacteriales bacterium]